MNVDLPLVVGRAPGVDLAVPNGRFEGLCFPKIQRVHRLHVVVVVNENCGPLWCFAPFPVHDGVSRRRVKLRFLQSRLAHQLDHEVGTLLHVLLVARIAAHRRNLEELHEVGNVPVLVLLDERHDRFHGWSPEGPGPIGDESEVVRTAPDLTILAGRRQRSIVQKGVEYVSGRMLRCAPSRVRVHPTLSVETSWRRKTVSCRARKSTPSP